MGAFGSAAAVIFGIIWTLSAMNMGAPAPFALFGVVFVILGIAQTAYHYKNATSKKRFSAFDITESREEPDPLNEYFSGRQDADSGTDAAEIWDAGDNGYTRADTGMGMDGDRNGSAAAFCPYCGAEAEADFQFCAKCGKRLPD